jgi:hypothetical protein
VQVPGSSECEDGGDLSARLDGIATAQFAVVEAFADIDIGSASIRKGWKWDFDLTYAIEAVPPGVGARLSLRGTAEAEMLVKLK